MIGLVTKRRTIFDEERIAHLRRFINEFLFASHSLKGREVWFFFFLITDLPNVVLFLHVSHYIPVLSFLYYGRLIDSILPLIHKRP